MPTIGVAKSRLVGEGVEPDLAAGAFNVNLERKPVGLILRTQKGKNPLFPGHRITLPECLEITLGCVTIPAPPAAAPG
jgi:deoxyinosine 3'endonuclease (endonuclease V)